MADKVYKGDIGTLFVVDCGSDISSATVKQLKVKKPDGTIDTWNANIYNSNYLTFTTVEGSLDQAGYYYLQSYVELTTWTGRGENIRFKVFDDFDGK